MARPLEVWKRDHARRENKRPDLSREERRALHRLRMEAKAKGVPLSSAGRGGLSPSLVLHVFRRDDYTCKVCGQAGRESGGIQLHHKGGVENPASRWLAKQGKSNDPNNIVTICKACHDRLHDDDRAKSKDNDSEG